MLHGIKVAVTGSSGFVGTHLTKKLRELKADVLEIDLRRGIDVSDWSQLKELDGFDCLIHLSAKTYVPDSYSDPRGFYHTNIVGTINALELCRLHKAKLVYASSYVYGVPEYLPIDELHPVKSYNPYAESKIIGERLCERYAIDFDQKILTLRPFNIYGPGQDTRFLISSIIDQAKTGSVQLKDPNPKRDFVYIDDVINAYLKAISHDTPGYNVFNIGLGKSYSVREISQEVIRHFGDDLKIDFTGEKRQSEVADTVADISKAGKLLNWSPAVGIEEGIRLCSSASLPP